MSSEVVLSPTSLRTFLRCPQQWAFAYLEKIVSPPTIRQILGIAVHYGAETNFRQKLETRIDAPEDEVLDAFATSYDYGAEEVEKPDEDPGKAKDQGAKLMRLHHRQLAPDIQPLWVERQSIIRLIAQHEEGCDEGDGCRCGVPFSATIDLVDEDRQVRDLKTAARRPTLGQHLMQVAGGAIAFEAETGEPATDLVVDTLVRTKVPDYVEDRWGGPVDSQMRRVFATQVQTASSMIKAGMFPASGIEAGPAGPCTWCGYKNLCPVWKGKRR